MSTSQEFTSYISPQTTAVNAVVNTSKIQLPNCISVVGILGSSEVISIQIPTVPSPNVAIDANWQNFYQDSAEITITSTNHAIAVPVGLIIRIVKPVTANNVGVRWS